MRFMLRVMLRPMFALTTMLVVFPAHAETDCKPGQDLIKIPEIRSPRWSGRLRGVITLSDEERSLPSADGTTCRRPQTLRFFKGYSTQEPMKPWPSTGDPIPGPTLRARVGDWVELAFLNQINPSGFPSTGDEGEDGTTEGCEIAPRARKVPPGKPGEIRRIYPRNDRYPNCLHGSSTANIHFHGTHTTPSTTGDNVLLFIRPALRQGGKIDPPDGFVMEQFSGFFKQCENKGPPQYWTEMPPDWQAKQKELLEFYDKTAPYKGVPGALPAHMKLWPKNEAKLNHKPTPLWPQYSIGAFPYCFRLPEHDRTKFLMGQAPGTHWYHAHKHGSTALNVGNGMTGAFVIEGAYDDRLRSFYRKPEHKNWGLQEQVLVIQRLESELNLKKPTNDGQPAVEGKLALSVNGRLNPVVTMKPNQVQLWRIVNGAARNFVQFDSFAKHGPGGQSVAWRQTAQDGVQFSYPNYQRFGAINAKFNLAAANRADLLVRAPAHEALYPLQVVQSVSDLPSGTPTTLLTVRVKADDKTIAPPMDFIKDEKDFPTFPPFLADIPGPIEKRRELYFNTNPFSGRDKVSQAAAKKGQEARMPTHEINGKLFDGRVVDQAMTLNTIEEWTLFNQTTNIAHPFHIHINPFQIVEVFQPNSAAAQKSGNCYADPLEPATWKPCKEQKLEPPFVWWDVFSIPTGRRDFLATSCTEVADCRLPPNIQKKYISCAKDPKDQKDKCAVTIPGYFKMRSRFADFTGQYVIHCHILAHEDRGMMQLVEVIPRGVTPTGVNPYEHH